MPRRSKLEIVAEVLEALARGPTNPTRLATLVNMPYDRLRALLDELEARGVVRIAEGGRSATVELTLQGGKLLRELRRLKRVLRDFGLEL
ncbi:MAG: winged helix-turn-helix domain-containing protein [Thermoproteota archaeon]